MFLTPIGPGVLNRACVTFSISIGDILTFRHYDFDIVTVDIFTVDTVTCHPSPLAGL